MKKIENIAICASAGTGKTYNLVKRYISLLVAGVNPSEIIALTFTRNAAGEIFSRIILRLLQLIKDPSSADDEFKDVEQEKFSEILKDLLFSLHKLQIGTLDSFFVKIITTFAFEFDLPADISIVDEQMQNYIKRKALKKTLETTVNRDDLKTFAEDFKRATFGREEKKIFTLLDGFVGEFHQLHLLSPNEDKWGQKEKIFKDKNSFIYEDFDLGTLEKESAILSRDDLKDKQREKIKKLIETATQLIDEDPTIKLSEAPNNLSNFFNAYEDLKRGTASITVERQKIEFNAEQCKILRKLVEYIAKRKIERKLKETSGVYKIISRYEKIYDRLIRSSGLITFNDLPFILSPNRELGEAHYALSSSADDYKADRLYIDYRLDARFNHWLIDEFQDTSLPQWKIIENLIDEIIFDKSGRRTFFYVGDPKQAIYGWRGGLVELFNAMKEKYNGNISEGEELTQSRRSCKEVIETVNKVFLNLNKALPEKFQNIWPFSEHKPRPEKNLGEAENGYCSLLQLVDKEKSLEAKAKIIASQIKEIEPFRRKMSAAVLCRKKKTVGELSELLREEKISVVMEGQSKLCGDNPLVPAFLSLFRFSYHPGDDFSWQHIMMTPFARLLGGGREEEALAILGRIQSSGFAKTIEYFKERLEAEAGIKFDPFSLLRLEQFIEAAWIFDSGRSKNCDDFIDFIREYMLSDSSSANAVQVMTIHKAKGLEYDIVFLPELKTENQSILKDRLQEGIKIRRGNDFLPEALSFFPEALIANMDSDIREWAEELNAGRAYENLCVLYVAMTRAKEALYLLADQSDQSGGSLHFQDILIETLSSTEKKESKIEGTKSLYECGDPNWFKFKVRKLYDEKAESKTQEEEEIISQLQSPAIVKPSYAKETKTTISLLLSDEAEKARQTGSCIHRLFEKIEWFESSDIDEIIENARKKLANEFSDEILRSALEAFKSSLGSCEFRTELSKPQAECELWREKSFSIIIDGKLVSGQFDRVVICKDESGRAVSAVILDFKSDNLNAEANIEDEAEKHRGQLELYRRALSKLLSLEEKNISAKIAFTSNGKIAKLS